VTTHLTRGALQGARARGGQCKAEWGCRGVPSSAVRLQGRTFEGLVAGGWRGTGSAAGAGRRAPRAPGQSPAAGRGRGEKERAPGEALQLGGSSSAMRVRFLSPTALMYIWKPRWSTLWPLPAGTSTTGTDP